MAYLALLEAPEGARFQEHADLLSESTEWLLSRYRFPKHTDGVMPGFPTDV